MSFPVEFRMRVIALVRAGKSIGVAADEFQSSNACLHASVNQDRIDHGQTPWPTSKDHGELNPARRRIRQLETELENSRNA